MLMELWCSLVAEGTTVVEEAVEEDTVMLEVTKIAMMATAETMMVSRDKPTN